jgi:uncharacterized protein
MDLVWHNLRSFKSALALLVIGAIVAFGLGGVEETAVVLLLAVLEISLSFENAVINATILRHMSLFWQRMFLTVGMVIAVLGMRLLLPVLVVVLTAKLPFARVVDLALWHPGEYAARLGAAHPVIAAFGGVFLLMVFLDFVIDEAKEVHWIGPVERPLARLGRVKLLAVGCAVVALAGATYWSGDTRAEVLSGGLVGMAVYLLVRWITWGLGVAGRSATGAPGQQLAGMASVGLFCYLEVMDASFSFDGVISAFAITGNVIDIMIGLAIGAMFIRELTVWLVRNDALSELIYVEHGGYYAVGALAVLLGISLRYRVPEALTASIGAVIILASLFSSLRAARTHKI